MAESSSLLGPIEQFAALNPDTGEQIGRDVDGSHQPCTLSLTIPRWIEACNFVLRVQLG